jgi:hypothetical protein
MFDAKTPVRRPGLHRGSRKPLQPRRPLLLSTPPAPDPRLPVEPIDPNARFIAE